MYNSKTHYTSLLTSLLPFITLNANPNFRFTKIDPRDVHQINISKWSCFVFYSYIIPLAQAK